MVIKYWLDSHGCFKLFFDGSFRGNPRVARVVWTIIITKGNTIVSFSYGLGIDSNNHAKLYAFGSIVLHKLKIKEIISGDSLFIVQQMYNKVTTEGTLFQINMQIIHQNLEGIGEVKFYHLKQVHNQIVAKR